ncbi:MULTISPECIES: hypothetical protein [Chitinophagaceae]
MDLIRSMGAEVVTVSRKGGGFMGYMELAHSMAYLLNEKIPPEEGGIHGTAS